MSVHEWPACSPVCSPACKLRLMHACRVGAGWFNSGYIFPEGFESRVSFRSSVMLDQLCVHECSVIGKGGKYAPAPTFQVLAKDREGEPLIAKSCTGCWTLVSHLHCLSGLMIS